MRMAAWRDGLCSIRLDGAAALRGTRTTRTRRAHLHHRNIVVASGSGYEQSREVRPQRERPWETLSLAEDENAAATPSQSSTTAQSPWDQGPRNRISSSSSRSSSFPGQVDGKSVVVNIVQKLRAIERKNFVENQHFTRRGMCTDAKPVVAEESAVEKFPWTNKFQMLEDFPKPPRTPSMAELTIPQEELRKLQRDSMYVANPIKIGYLGVTKAIVRNIHERWQRNAVLRVKCTGPPAVNMKKTHEELEAKTGGLVIWRTAGMAVLYRGKGYFARHENEQIAKRVAKFPHDTDEQTLGPPGNSQMEGANQPPGNYRMGSTNQPPENYRTPEDYRMGSTDQAPMGTQPPGHYQAEGSSLNYMIESGEPQDPEKEYFNEVDAILATLGPRFDDWMGARPVPVDADLLPAVVKNYNPPLRMLPYKVRPKLTGLELTVLRKLARPLPPHFVLGRNRGLQGLASGIVKLWEKTEIVKIGVKRGVANTRNQLIAEQLKRLTGGVVLTRDKYFIILYRGKDFLPPSVSAVLKERETEVSKKQEAEEKLRHEGGVAVSQPNSEPASGSLAESQLMKQQWEATWNPKEEKNRVVEALVAVKVREQRLMEGKLAKAMSKKREADLQIAKLEQSLKLSAPPKDRETLTDEERHLFRKIGVRMDQVLLLGVRGVFSGVIENMHLHWKYRELVKLIMKEKDKLVARDVGRMLEAESGGILVDVVTTSQGQAIIVYRGKNYQRPAELRPRTLLTKRKALARSKEIQRKEALQAHIEKLEDLIKKMRKDYDLILTSSTLPESPRSALYKEIQGKYDKAEEDLLDEEIATCSSEDEEDLADESGWDLESEEEQE